MNPIATTPANARQGLLKDQAYERLRDLVLSGQLAKMPFLSERKLAKHLEMSLSPVRSAVERLAVEGLLEIGPQQGILVRELSAAEVADHFEVRQALEGLVVRKLAGRLEESQLSELQTNVRAHEVSLKSGDLQRYIELDSEFHLLLAEFCGNADIERVLRQLRNRIVQVVLRVIEHLPERMLVSVDEHRQIVAALESGDAEQAAACMTQHLEAGLKVLVPGVAQQAALPHEATTP